eukprot:15837309-Heterocapsa_arctica.AAC.1
MDHVHTEQDIGNSHTDKNKKANFLRILQDKSKNKKSICIKSKAEGNKHAQKPASIMKVGNEPMKARARPFGLATWLAGPLMAH